jgi:hypothetical protein
MNKIEMIWTIFCYTVILIRRKKTESAQLSFDPKVSGEFRPIWVIFVQYSAKSLRIREKFAQIGKNSPEIFETEDLLVMTNIYVVQNGYFFSNQPP